MSTTGVILPPPAQAATLAATRSKTLNPKTVWLTVGGVLIVVVLLSLLIPSGDKDEPKRVSSGTTSARAAAPGTTSTRATPRSTWASPAPAPTNRDGKFEFGVIGVETRQGSLGGLSDPPMGEWVIVTVTVSNIGDEQRTFYANNQKLIDSQGREFESEFWAAEALNDQISVDLNPGFTITFQVPFDVPPGTVPTSIELHDSAFSGGVTMTLE